jgi:Flp pilus assembly protein TadD
LSYIQTALKTNSKNPALLCHAGLIYSKNGNTSRARSLLQQALQNQPVVAADLLAESEATLKTL